MQSAAAKIIKFPVNETKAKSPAPSISMTMTRTVNGMNVLTNLANLTQEELLFALLRDAVMAEKEQAMMHNLSN